AWPVEAADSREVYTYTCRSAENRAQLDELAKIEAQSAALDVNAPGRLMGPQAACQYLERAERLKRLGDPRAQQFYLYAIQANPAEPAYPLFYGDYLRNYR